MTKKEAIKQFEEIYLDLYIREVDYWTAQLTWTEFVDNLNRNGEITDKQRDNWTTPFPYGKHLKPNKRQLELKVYGD